MFNLKIRDWNIEAITGYKPITTFYTDFSIADNFGLDAIQDTYDRCKAEWASDYKFLTELVMALNWKIWEHSEHNRAFALLYDKLWRELADYTVETLEGDELRYYFRITD